MPDDKRPLKVFLCHAHADKAQARDLYRTIKRRGLQPWLDAEDLLPTVYNLFIQGACHVPSNCL